MTSLTRIGGPQDAFNEARQQIDAWQRAYPEAASVVMILDAGDDILLTVVGANMRGTNLAGLCAAGMALALEEPK